MKKSGRRRAAGLLAALVLSWLPIEAEARSAAQDDRQDQIEALSRVLGMTTAEIEAMDLSSEEMQFLLEGYSEETVVVGTRAQPRTVAESLPWCINTGKSLIPLTLLFFAQKRNLLIPLELSRVMHQGTGSLVIDTITAGGKLDAPVAQRVFWCVLEGIVAIALLLGGGLVAAQAATLATGLPFALVLVAMCYSTWKGLRASTVGRVS